MLVEEEGLMSKIWIWTGGFRRIRYRVAHAGQGLQGGCLARPRATQYVSDFSDWGSGIQEGSILVVHGCL